MYQKPRRYERPFHWEKLETSGTISVPDHRLCYLYGLPFEILSEIFHLSISWTRSSDSDSQSIYFLSHVQHGDTPLSLLSVCKRWRGVALASPLLWNSIYPSWNSLACMKFWLKVAPNVPFHLKITDANLDFGIHPEFPSLMLRLFASVSHRWKSLSIELSLGLAKEFLSILQCPTKAPLPIEGLILSTRREMTDDAGSAIVRQLSSLPHLKRLEIDTFKYRFDLQSIPWGNLKHLVLNTGLRETEAISCIEQCTAARTIDFRLLPLHFSRPGSQKIVTLPHLTSLVLVGGDSISILQYLSLPFIQSLCIAFTKRDHLALDNFLARTPTLALVILTDKCRGRPTEYGSSEIPDEDIVTYFLDSHLHRIPSVYLSYFGARAQVPKIIAEYPNARDMFPRMICWEVGSSHPEQTKKIPFSHFDIIGWNDDLTTHPKWKVFWQFQDGRIEFSPTRQSCSHFRV